MSSTTLSSDLKPASGIADRAPLLRWMIFTGLCVLAAVLLWRYGLIHLMLASDRTYISAVIVALYILTSLHCLWRTIAIAREGDAGRAAAQMLAQSPAILATPDTTTTAATDRKTLPPGLVADHIRDLVLKADAQGSGPIVAALAWLQGTLLGNVATMVAVMAVAAVGFMMLTGRLNWRFGATVILGTFILFGAGAIVSGIQSAAAAG